MTPTHQAWVLHSAQNIAFETTETLPPRNDEVQIAPRATGICGTDQHYYQNGRNGIYEITEPLVLGHEAAGQVVAVGADVTNLKVGDSVAVEPQQACLNCRHCRTGSYNLCGKMRFNGSASSKPPVQGSLQERFNHPARLVYPLPKTVSYEEGAMVEPLSVAVHSVRKANIQAGQTVLITGAGAIGLLCASVAKVSGASRVAMVDVDEARLDFARQQGLADSTLIMPFGPAEGETSTEMTARLAKDLVGELPGPPDVSFECTGVETCLNLCVHSNAPGGRVIVVGMGKPLQTLSLGVALVREIEVIGVWRYANTFPTAISLLETRRVDVKPLVTHTFDLAQAEEALKLVVAKPANLVKCLITSST